MVWDITRREIVLYGGSSNAGGSATTLFGDTWVYRAGQWAQRTPVNDPGPRAHYGMAYDPVRQNVVLFGGTDGSTPKNDTWTWNGTNWSLADSGPAGPSRPTARGSTAMAFDAGLGEAILFGGFYSGTVDAQTWSWNGAVWTNRTGGSPATPPARQVHAMADDGAGTVYLVAGVDSAGSVLLDLWCWVGGAWSQKTGLGSDRRKWHQVAFDHLRGNLVLYGGTDGYVAKTATREWDGTAWTTPVSCALGTTCVPGPSMIPAMAFDRDRGRVVLFGGDTSLAGGAAVNKTREYVVSQVTVLGAGCPVGSATPALSTCATSVVGLGKLLCLDLTGAPSAPSVLLVGTPIVPPWLLPLTTNCYLHVFPAFTTPFTASTTTGWTWSATLPTQPVGARIGVQAAILTSVTGLGVATSNGLELVLR